MWFMYVVEPIFYIYSTVTNSSLGSISCATVLISSHWTVTLQQLSFTALRSCIKRNLLFPLGTTPMGKHNVACYTFNSTTFLHLILDKLCMFFSKFVIK